MTTRLRQVALVARELAPVGDALRMALRLGPPYRDPGVAQFGLENVVLAVGDTFLEVVAPVRDGTTAGRYLERRGGDGGYMAIFQVPDIDEARRRVDALGVRVAWQSDRPDMASVHLHPKDVAGAIVSLDQPDPPESWRPAGPDWTGGAPDRAPGGVTGLGVRAVDPAALAARWAEVLGVDVHDADGGPRITLDDRRQVLRFLPAGEPSEEGIVEVSLAVPAGVRVGRDELEIGGVRLVLTDAG